MKFRVIAIAKICLTRIWVYIKQYKVLIAALIFSAGYHSAPIFSKSKKSLDIFCALFLTIGKIELYLGSFFTKICTFIFKIFYVKLEK